MHVAKSKCVELICVFVFAYAKSSGSHEATQRVKAAAVS